VKLSRRTIRRSVGLAIASAGLGCVLLPVAAWFGLGQNHTWYIPSRSPIAAEAGQGAVIFLDERFVSLAIGQILYERYEVSRASGADTPNVFIILPAMPVRGSGLLPELGSDELYTHCIVPHWLPGIVLLGAGLWLGRRQRIFGPGRCGCGYDLTGNVSGRCPECGQATDNRTRAGTLAGVRR
jgi:hypothetical protein